MEKEKNEHSSVTFLRSLFQECVEGFINLRFLPSTKNYFIPLSKIDSIPGILENHKGENAFFGVATRGEGDGTRNGILQIPALWIDRDLYKLTDEQKEDSRQKHKDFPLKPTFVINSGGGLYDYWLLKEPDSRQEIPRVENILKRLASYFHGDLASTDSSRILRIPGSLNHKYQHLPQVKVIESHPERQYNLDDFEILPPIKETQEKRAYSKEANERLSAIMECEFLKHCGKARETLSEPEWYAMVSILAREAGGPNLIHSLSKGYPRYSPQETDKKILHGINNSGPTTCQRIKTQLWDCGNDCGVTSPVVLAVKTKGKEPDAVVLESNGHHFSIIQAKDIVSSKDAETDWLWEGILPCGGLGLVVAKPKVGKTTLAFNLAVAVSRGELFLGRKTLQRSVVYLALEEKKGEIQKNLSKLGVVDEPLFFHFGPAPVEAMKEVGPLIKEIGAGLLVIDIMQKFCRVKDLNDYSQVTRALEPLMATARQLNCHILLVHHAGKRDRDDGDDILGSTGLLGGVDTSIHIKKREKRRTFFTIQRYGTDTPETVLTLTLDGRLEATGSREEVEVDETIPPILEALEQGPQTINEIWNGIERRHELVTKALHGLLEQGKIKRTGSGKKGDPYRYEKIPIFPSPVYIGEGGKEFKNEDNAKESLRNFFPHDSQKNEEVREGIGKEFSGRNEATKDPELSPFEGEI